MFDEEVAGQTARPGGMAARVPDRVADVYEELFELAPDAYVFTTPGGRIVHANRAACALLNCPRTRLHGASLNGFLNAGQFRRVLRDLPPAPLDSQALHEREVTLRPIRRPPLTVGLTVAVARDGSGRRQGLRWSLRDITERKRVEARLQASLSEKELLLREVYHRVKNSLQVISSLLSLQEVHVADQTAVAVLRNARDRVRSMALVHERLYRSSDLSQVDFDEYLRQLARELQHSYGLSESIRFAFRLDSVRLGIDVAVPCSMIVHELVSNALRHAFPGGGPGRVEIALQSAGPGLGRLSVADDGVGLPPPDARARSGSLGLQLVEMMVEQIGGRLDVSRAPGACFDVLFPVTQPGRAEGAP